MRAALDRSAKSEAQTLGVRNLPHLSEIQSEGRLSPERNIGNGQEGLLDPKEYDGLEMHTPNEAASPKNEEVQLVENQRPADHATPSGNFPNQVYV
jgi:hypothetical protein